MTVGLTSFIAFLISFVISVGTLSTSVFSRTNPVSLFVVYIIVPAMCAILYTLSQLILIRQLGDKWAVLDVIVSLFFFVTGQLFHTLFSTNICTMTEHYIDGMFFGNVFTLLAVMMIYKYWDSITQEDLEFAIAGTPNKWEVSDPLLGNDKIKQR
jgi:hypothetical protein